MTYLDTNSEAELLVTILMAINDSEPSEKEEKIADRILWGLIELGLSDMDAGPDTLREWADMVTWGDDINEGADYRHLVDFYKGNA